MPRLHVVNQNDNGNEKNFGYFLTNEMPTPTIQNEWIFNNNIVIKNGLINFDDNVYLALGDSNKFLLASADSTKSFTFSTSRIESTWQKISTELDVSNIVSIGSSSILSDGFSIIMNNSGITTTGYCEADYFNARSDKRAKENIQPVKFSALDVVKHLPVYTFNYKNKTEVVPGILAQDLLELNLPVELVNNKEATGENEDYMTIKESKLIYILLKAIQEQQAEIEELKKKINI